MKLYLVHDGAETLNAAIFRTSAEAFAAALDGLIKPIDVPALASPAKFYLVRAIMPGAEADRETLCASMEDAYAAALGMVNAIRAHETYEGDGPRFAPLPHGADWLAGLREYQAQRSEYSQREIEEMSSIDLAEAVGCDVWISELACDMPAPEPAIARLIGAAEDAARLIDEAVNVHIFDDDNGDDRTGNPYEPCASALRDAIQAVRAS